MAESEPPKLADALESLRDELEQAWNTGRGKRIRFRVSDVTLTVQAVAKNDTSGGGKLRWWLIEAGAEHSKGSETTETLVLTLTPGLYDAQGNYEGPLDVAAVQPTPGN